MCKCQSFTLTSDLHVIYTTIDIYMHNTWSFLVNIFFSCELVPDFTFCWGGTTTITRDFIWNSLYIVVVRGLVWKFASNHMSFCQIFVCLWSFLLIWLFSWNLLPLMLNFFVGSLPLMPYPFGDGCHPCYIPKMEKKRVCHAMALPFTLKIS